MKQLTILIDAVEKQADTKRKQIKRREKGVKKREDYIQEQQDKTQGLLKKLEGIINENPKAKKTEVAQLLGVSRQHLYRLLDQLKV